MPERIPRVNALIKHELGQVLLEEFEPPQGVIVTITKVSTSKDLHYARVWVSILPLQKAAETMKLLKHHGPRLQYEMHQRIILHVSPRITFVLDKTSQRVEHIESILDSLKDSP